MDLKRDTACRRRKHNGVAIKNDGTPLGYTPVMTDATKATTFDDIGSELKSSTQRRIYSFIAMSTRVATFRNSLVPGEVVDLHDHTAAQQIIRGSGPEQMVVKTTCF